MPRMFVFFVQESFRCHVQPQLIAASLIQVALAADALVVQLLRDFVGISLPPLPPLGGTTGNVLEYLEEILERIHNKEADEMKKKEAEQEGLNLIMMLREQRQLQLKQLQQEKSRILTTLQRYLTVDTLNETLYLKKHKPPILPGSQNRPASNVKNGKIMDEAEEEESVDAYEREDNAPEAPRVGKNTICCIDGTYLRVLYAKHKAVLPVSFQHSKLSCIHNKREAALSPLTPC